MLTTASHHLQRRLCLPKYIRITPNRDMTILSTKSAEEYKKENYSARMERTGRPLSPSVTIYGFPIVALSSIANRVSGVALTFGAFGVATIEIVGGSGTAISLAQDIGTMGVLAPVAKFSVSFSFFYHYLGGLRHLLWDSKPDILTNDDVKKSAFILIGGSLLTSGVMAFV